MVSYQSFPARLASMGEMLGNIAHQWRQPLNGLSLIVQNIEDAYDFNELNKESIHQTVKKSMELILFMSNTIDDFRNFFREDREMVVFNVLGLVRDSLHLVHMQIMKHKITLVLQYGDNRCQVESSESFQEINIQEGKCNVMGYPNEFKQAILNFLINSRDAILTSGVVKGEIIVGLEKVHDSCSIIIEDNGGGIDPGIIEKIFDPYFSSKDEGQGTGIGLYMSKIIIEEHMNGKITVENTDRGAKFTITLKLA
ncbi:MAG: HAMP domain-containing histidine kinase [Nitrospinae bacterium]|nr:HAMP domain-containing histidine kinase [Nitrospinota bacterium]